MSDNNVDRYGLWTHGNFPDGIKHRCVDCMAELEEGYYKVIDQRVLVCCDYCAGYLLAEIPLDDLLMMRKLVGLVDELNTEALDEDGGYCLVPASRIADVNKWLTLHTDKDGEFGG